MAGADPGPLPAAENRSGAFGSLSANLAASLAGSPRSPTSAPSPTKLYRHEHGTSLVHWSLPGGTVLPPLPAADPPPASPPGWALRAPVLSSSQPAHAGR
ncbi:hypothetical protein ACPA9J_25315 [Pseudomonas aeruginosa]